MNSYLITPSLINSFQWFQTCSYIDKDRLRTDFLRTLRKEYYEPSKAAQKGIKFENDVMSYLENGDFSMPKFLRNTKEYEYCIHQIASHLTNKNGIWQKPCSKDVKFRQANFVLYGKIDYCTDNYLYDIKTTKNYNPNKFLNNIQHYIYLYCTDINKFKYLIADFKSVYVEEYEVNKNDLELKIFNDLNKLLKYLDSDPEAKEIYKDKWKSFKKNKKTS